MDILDYFMNVKAQKQIDNWAKKLQNKKIVLYGAGEYFQILADNYDLSQLNIVGICDRKFEKYPESNLSKYKTLVPEELKSYDYDAILLALYDDTSLIRYLESEFLIGTPNENKLIDSLIEPPFWYIFKVLLGI